MNRIVATIDDLPELPFEKVLSYLNLEDRLKARAVSRRWYHKINSFKVKTLCYAERPLGFIREKHQLASGAFACNFIFSTKFDSFFSTFGRSILFTLKRLRLCEIDPDKLNAAAFALTINTFVQLEELSIFEFRQREYRSKEMQIELNLPMLTSLQLEGVHEIQNLTLDAPRLQNAKLATCWSLNLVIVHGESVERLLTDQLRYTEVKNLKNLQHIYSGDGSAIDSTLLSDLGQLKEIHTMHSYQVADLFEQKRRYGRTDLKIYLLGFLLNGPDDPAIRSLDQFFRGNTLVHLAEDRSRLADEMPFFYTLCCSAIESVRPDVVIDILSRCTDLYDCIIEEPVQDIERFLNLLKNLQNIDKLSFWVDQPQNLFDRLSEYSAVRTLTIYDAPPSLEFLLKLKGLTHLDVRFSIGIELIRNLLEELPFLWWTTFKYNNELADIEFIRNSRWTHRKGFKVWCAQKILEVADLEAVIQFLVQSAPQESGHLQLP